jgi:uncharacterized protein (TIGR00255 family)
MSLNSMTGFGRHSYREEDLNITIEIKTLNSRYRDIKIKSSFTDGSLEFAIRKEVTKSFSRGRIEVSVRAVPHGKMNGENIDELLGLSKETGDSISLTHHLLFKIAQNLYRDKTDISLDESGKNSFMEALNITIDKVSSTRDQEGLAMGENLLSLIDNINKLVESAKLKAKTVPENIKNRISEKLKDVIRGEMDKISLEREIAYLGEKADITEELVRLDAHIKSFNSLFKENIPVGRKMEFLSQEMHREINTLGSKSQDFDLSSIGVALKNELEKVREIAANIE